MQRLVSAILILSVLGLIGTLTLPAGTAQEPPPQGGVQSEARTTGDLSTFRGLGEPPPDKSAFEEIWGPGAAAPAQTVRSRRRSGSPPPPTYTQPADFSPTPWAQQNPGSAPPAQAVPPDGYPPVAGSPPTGTVPPADYPPNAYPPPDYLPPTGYPPAANGPPAAGYPPATNGPPGTNAPPATSYPPVSGYPTTDTPSAPVLPGPGTPVGPGYGPPGAENPVQGPPESLPGGPPPGYPPSTGQVPSQGEPGLTPPAGTRASDDPGTTGVRPGPVPGPRPEGVAGRRPRPRPNPQPELAPEAKPCPGAQILARVGSHVILACEVQGAVNEILQKHKDEIPEEQFEAQREMLTQRLLEQQIDYKLVFQDAERELPAEGVEQVMKNLGEKFEEDEVAKRVKAAGLETRQDLEAYLAGVGTSLEREKKLFVERTLAQSWLGRQIADEEEITYDEILAEYQRHAADYEHEPRARWEQLTVLKSEHPDKQEALAKLAWMGNQVIHGTPLEQVARQHSEGTTAQQGGARDWTTKGSLVSEVIDRAIFGLPVGSLSRILEDDQGYHIIRVAEREDAFRTPFVEAQVDIRKRLQDEKREKRMKAYIARLKQEIPVWTVFDKPADGRELVSDRRGL